MMFVAVVPIRHKEGADLTWLVRKVSQRFKRQTEHQEILNVERTRSHSVVQVTTGRDDGWILTEFRVTYLV